jgi:hypothetical protein
MAIQARELNPLMFVVCAGYGTEAQEGGCSICPSGYYRNGFARGPCLPCPFGMTSPAGAVLEECVPMAQSCPVGQIVDPADQPVSVSDCHCLPGFGGECLVLVLVLVLVLDLVKRRPSHVLLLKRVNPASQPCKSLPYACGSLLMVFVTDGRHNPVVAVGHAYDSQPDDRFAVVLFWLLCRW